MSEKRTWGDMFATTPPSSDAAPLSAADAAKDELDLVPGVDPTAYRACLLKRGAGRPALFIDFRSFDARSGALRGTMLSYPMLSAIDYVDDHTLLLDFGMRQIRIEGEKLGELIAHLHAGSVTAVQAYSPKIWGDQEPVGVPVVRSITHIGLGQAH